MKRFASLKSTSSSETGPDGSRKRVQRPSYLNSKKVGNTKNSPHPIPEKPPTNASNQNNGNGHLSFHTPPSGRSMSDVSPSHSKLSLPDSNDGQPPPTIGNKSAAPTVSTNPDTINSDAAYSKADTTVTAGGAVSSHGRGGGEGSTFSSPTPSVRSLTTTLTTIQSAAPSNLLAGPNNQTQHDALAVPHSNQHTQNQSSSFSHQFPTSPPPASAIPSHVSNHTSSSHPSTYNMVIANNLLTDNASILTLASSSKRRRRNSLDTNASVRALAPSSLFGSRESLPLSVLSSNINDQPGASGMHQGRHTSVGVANTERASVYSSSGIAPALSSERNSYYTGKQANIGDGGSVRSGLPGHGRNDSITGSIGGHSSPLASPREMPPPGRISRRNSGWGEVNEEDISSDREEQRIGTGKSKDR